MGLELVELVMDCEDEFGISIPDAAVSDVRTVGEFFDIVLTLIRSTGKPELRHRPDLEEYAWDRVCSICGRLFLRMIQKDVTVITRSTRFIEDLGSG